MLAWTTELYRYRVFVWNLVLTDLKLRYRKSFLGFLWQLINPFVLMTILAVVFSTIIRFRVEHFAAFLLCGLLPWSFFSQGVTSGMVAVVNNESLIKKVYVPKLAFPVAAVLSQLVDIGTALVPLLLLLWVMGVPLTAAVAFVPIALVIVVLPTLGLALILGTAYVYLRDTHHFGNLLLQGWFYLTPIIYPIEALAESYQPFFRLNPMAYVIDSFRDPLYAGRVPDLSVLAVALGFGLLLLFAGVGFFLSREDRFIFHLS